MEKYPHILRNNPRASGCPVNTGIAAQCQIPVFTGISPEYVTQASI